MGLFDPVLEMRSCHDGCCCCLVWCGSLWTPDRALPDLRTRFLRGRRALRAAWFARCCLKLVLLSALDDPAILVAEPSDEPPKRGSISATAATKLDCACAGSGSGAAKQKTHF